MEIFPTYEVPLKAFTGFSSSSFSGQGSRVSHSGDVRSRHPVRYSAVNRADAAKMEVSTGSSSSSVKLNQQSSEQVALHAAAEGIASCFPRRDCSPEAAVQIDLKEAENSNGVVGADAFVVCHEEAAKAEFTFNAVDVGVNANQGFQIYNHSSKLVLDFV